MRVVPVPDQVRAMPWCIKTTVYSAPNGDLTDEEIAPAEALHYYADMPSRGTFVCTSVMLMLDDDDIEKIKNGAQHLMIGWPGVQVPVFMVPEIIDLDDL